MSDAALPPGFVLDDAPPLPPGFTLDGASPARPAARGVDAIPGLASGQRAPEKPPAPPRDDSFTGKIKGAVEAALSVVSGLTTGGIGGVGGAWQHVAESGANAIRRGVGAKPLPTTAPDLETAATQGAARGTYQPRTLEGQEMAAPVNEALAAAGPALAAGPRGMTGMGGRTAAEAAGLHPAARLVGDVTAATTDSAKGATARGLGRMLDVNPEKVKAAGAAQDQGMTVLPHHVSDQPATQKIGQATQHVPLSGGRIKQNERAFTKAVIRQINPEEKGAQLTPDVVNRALDRAGSQIGDNMRAVEVPEATLAPKLEGIRKSLGVESDETARIVSNYLGQLESLASENGGKIPGVALRKLDSEIGAKMRAMGTDKGDLLGQLDNLQDAIRDSAQAHMTPEQAAQTKTARTQYAKTMSLVPAAKDIATTGYLPPSKLLDLASNTKTGKYLLASGKGGEWHDLAKAGALVAEPEGHARLTVGARVGLGAGGVWAATHEPTIAAAAATGAVGLSRVYNHLGPKLVRRLAKEYDRKAAAEAPPPKAPPPEPVLTDGAGGPQNNRPGPRGGKVLPAPEADLMPSARTEAGAAPTRDRNGAIAPEGLVPALGDEMPSTGVRDAPLEMLPVLGEPGADVQLGAGGPQITAPGPRAGRVLEAPAAEFPMELAADERPAPRRMIEPRGLHSAVDDKAPPRRVNPEKRGNRAEQIPAVPGRPDLPEVMVGGDLGRADKSPSAPGEVGRDAATGAAMQSDNAALARQLELQRRYGDGGGKMEPSVDQVPVGEATEIVPENVKPARELPTPKEPKPEKIPTGEATELKPETVEPAGAPKEIDPRLARIDELRSRTDSKAVHAALDKRAAEVKKQMKAEAAAKKAEADVAELEAAAAKTDDPELRQTLLAEANKLRAEKPAIGEVKEGQPPLPKPEAPKKIPAGEATELQPELVEAANAPEEVTQQGGLQVEPEGRDVGGQTAEAGPGDSLQRAAQGGGQEPIPVGEATEVTPAVEGVVPEATAVENAAPEPKKVKRMLEPTNSLSRTASWVIRNKTTGEVVMETFDKKKVDALNTAKYEAVPVQEHLAGLNREAKRMIEPKVEAPATQTEYLIRGRHRADTKRTASITVKAGSRAEAMEKARENNWLLPDSAEPVGESAGVPKRTVEPKTETFEELSARMKATPVAERSAEDMARYWDLHRERARAEEAKAEAERAAVKKTRSAETKGMTLAEIKAHDYMRQQVLHDGKPMARSAWVEKQLEAGATPSVEMVDKVKPMSRMAHFRASNAEQRAHEAKVKAGGKVPEYFLGDFKVSKTEYEYAVQKSSEKKPTKD